MEGQWKELGACVPGGGHVKAQPGPQGAASAGIRVLWAGAGDGPGSPGLVSYGKAGVTPCTPAPGETSISSTAGMLAVTTGCPEGAWTKSRQGRSGARSSEEGAALQSFCCPPRGVRKGLRALCWSQRAQPSCRGPTELQTSRGWEGPGPRGLGSPHTLSLALSIKVGVPRCELVATAPSSPAPALACS